MPTPHSVLSAVAHALDERVDPNSRTDVGRFYKDVLPTYSLSARELISEWLGAAEHPVSTADVNELVSAVRKESSAPAKKDATSPSPWAMAG